MWLWTILSIWIGSIAAQSLTDFDCSVYPALNQTFNVSAVKGTPPTMTKYTFYFNPCEPVGVPICASDDYLCGTELVDSGDRWVMSAVKPYGSASSGAQTIVQEVYETIHVYFSQALWSGSQLFASVRMQCGPETELLFVNEPNGSIDSKLLTLNTPALCGFSPERAYTAEMRYQWSATEVVAIVAAVIVVAFCGGIVFLWLFLRLDSHGDENIPEYKLTDALNIVLSGLAHNFSILSRPEPKKN